MLTPAELAARKLTLSDLPASTYDHKTQTREFANREESHALYSDTQFDGEKS
jgi:hypothetical protein